MPVGSVTVRQVMTRRVHSVPPSATLLTATRLLRRYNISGLPVIDRKRRVIGVLSEKDVARALSESGLSFLTNKSPIDLFLMGALPSSSQRQDRADPLTSLFEECLSSVRVREVMSQDPVLVDPQTSLDVAARIMQERNINRLPVVSGERLIGILTRHDVLSAWV